MVGPSERHLAMIAEQKAYLPDLIHPATSTWASRYRGGYDPGLESCGC